MFVPIRAVKMVFGTDNDESQDIKRFAQPDHTAIHPRQVAVPHLQGLRPWFTAILPFALIAERGS